MIGALLSLAGGLIANNQKKKAQARADWMNSPQGIRENFEAANLNPLLAFQAPGVGTGAGAPVGLGDGLAQSFAAAGSLVDSRQAALEMEKARLETENQRLEKIANDHILTPDTPGIYGAGNGKSDSRDFRSGGSGPSAFPLESDALTPPVRDVYNLYADVFDPQTGRYVSIPNPDLMDAGPVESAYALSQIGSADLVQNGFGLGGVGGQDKKARKAKPKPKKQTKQKRGDRRSRRQN
jgi:hypothetical protein